jgi:hypothetical protein
MPLVDMDQFALKMGELGKQFPSGLQVGGLGKGVFARLLLWLGGILGLFCQGRGDALLGQGAIL